MSDFIKPLPAYLLNRYMDWKVNSYEKNKNWYNKVSIEGQKPSTMVISCCDSRIHVTSIFGANLGEFFIHRNIANLIPPYNPDDRYHGTSAALEYAVTILKVSNIIILGHSKCGGIKNGFDMCAQKQNKKNNLVFTNKWLNLLKPSYERIINNKEILNKDKIKALEKESIKTSINNMYNFPFIKEATKNDLLTIHGLWFDIGAGELEFLESNSMFFEKV